jgi:serine/threonine-protein kinase
VTQKSISHYQVIEKIGAGGMGEVYRASDPKLGRDVAIKVLPEVFARDKERMARFQREAQVLASLNHPNIGAIYGLEEDGDSCALVLELVEGPTLAERIDTSPVPADLAVSIALQIAEAVESAHERGIVHRDLKPANIKLTLDGKVKILDFGLAKALEGDRDGSGSAFLSQSPTITGRTTGAQVIVGTAAYMSPEQARGENVDRRADIWAFGVILFEMLTGRKLFSGETVSDTLASVLMRDPDWDLLPANLPVRLRRLLRRCLQRDPKRRLRDIGEARIVLEEIAAGAPDEEAPKEIGAARPMSRRLRLALAGAGALLVAGATAIGWTLRPEGAEVPLRKYEIPIGDVDPNLASGTTLAISPDGGSVAYLHADRLWIRELAKLEARAIDGSNGAQKPFWSPDGAYVAFGAGGKLWKVASTGGTPTMLCELPDPFTPAAGGAWKKDGRIVFCTGSGDLFEVSSKGGDPSSILAPEAETEEDFHNVQALPGDRGLLFVVHRNEGFDQIDLLVNGKRRQVIRLPGQSISMPVYSPSGHILFRRSPTNPGIWALPFSLSKLEATGEPFLAVPDGALPSVASDGTLVYVHGNVAARSQLVWADRTGRVLGPIGPVQEQDPFPALSPDGRLVAIAVKENDNRDIWIIDTVRETKTRLTFEDGSDSNPMWSPSGEKIYYLSGSSTDQFTIRMRSADGSGEPIDVVKGWGPRLSRDGKYLFYDSHEGGTWNIWYVALGADGAAKGEPVHFLKSKATEAGPALSPDGRYLAYFSMESGEDEIYVKRFPEGDGKWQVSVSGGHWPNWSADGKTLYYADGDDLMAVPVETGSSLRLGSPQKLFTRTPCGVQLGFGWSPNFDLTADGERFVFVQAAGGEKEKQASLGITVAQNWYAEFRAAPER